MKDLLISDPGLADLVLRAEASDWWWWFGDGHSTAFDGDFDALFRDHLKAIWLALGKPVPDELHKSVHALVLGGRPATTTQRTKRPQTQLEVALDGTAGWFFKWLGAGEALQSFGAIHRADSLMSRVLYGNDDAALYLRLDARERCREALADAHLELSLAATHGPITVSLWPPDTARGVQAACAEVLEVRIPLRLLGIDALPGRLRGHLTLLASTGEALERFPGMGDLELDLLSALDSALNLGV